MPVSHRRAWRALAAPLVVAALAAAVPSSAAALTGAQEVDFLNQQRAANGLPAGITENPAWSAACAAHMNYLAVNRVFQHGEDASKPGYTADGAWAGGHSVLTSGGASFGADGRNAFEHAPIHLMQMLDPFLQTTGAANGCLVTLGDIDRQLPAAQTFSYPGDGATVPVSEQTYEGPFVPAAFVGLNRPGDVTRSVVTGPSLYFFHGAAGPYGYWNSKGRITAASLTGPDGPVDVRWVDDSTTSPTLGDLGPYLAPGGIVIPVQPLADDTTYTASVTFQPSVGGDPVGRTWTVHTGDGGSGDPDDDAVVPVEVPSAAPAAAAPAADPDDATLGTGADEARDPVTGLTLGRRSLAFKDVPNADDWVTIERARGTKRISWVLLRSFAVRGAAKGVTRVKFPKQLPAGRYRIRVRNQTAEGADLGHRTVVIRARSLVPVGKSPGVASSVASGS